MTVLPDKRSLRYNTDMRETVLNALWLPALIRVVGLVIAAAILDRSLRVIFRRLLKDVPRSRSNTILSIIGHSTTFVISLIVLGMILSELGLDIAPLIASAGIAGLAVGFGAQTLVKDVISGLFLLLDDTMRTGETVKVSGIKGTVKKIGVRSFVIEDDEGVIHTIPTGSISTVSNYSR